MTDKDELAALKKKVEESPVPLLNGPVEPLPASELKKPSSDRIIEGSRCETATLTKITFG
jgi:hypothetical protein